MKGIMTLLALFIIIEFYQPGMKIVLGGMPCCTYTVNKEFRLVGTALVIQDSVLMLGSGRTLAIY